MLSIHITNTHKSNTRSIKIHKNKTLKINTQKILNTTARPLALLLVVSALTVTTDFGFMSIQAQAKELTIQPGTYRPLYLSKNSPLVAVDTFKIDELPVTNIQFYQFLKENPKFRQRAIAPIFADAGYLKHWINTKDISVPKKADFRQPVVNVSWYAANQYCRAQNKRLPTVEQWEYVAQASTTNKNGSLETGYNQRILDWYSKSSGSKDQLADVGQSPANYWGVKDMHGLIWEWTENFNNSLVTGESRADSNLNQQMFCGSGAAGAVDPSDYAAFMRYGFRSSLEAKYTVSSLGFRCASN